MSETIQIPSERYIQLRQLADKAGLTIAETIGRLMREEVLRGSIPDCMPGFVVSAHHGVVEFGFCDGETVMLPGGAATRLAGAIEAYALRKGGAVLDMDAGGFTVARVGQGVRITLPHGQSRVVSRDVARDIGGCIRRTIATKLREQAQSA